MTHQMETYGLILLFVFVAVECCGIPLPGETALITASVLASTGRFNIVEVIAVAAAAAIIGDTTGYWIARTGGRKAIDRIPIVRDHLPKLLPRGEQFFERHGPKTVFLGRFVSGLRITVAWLAGISHMPWLRFLGWNAAGGIAWATAFGLASYYFGKHIVEVVATYGLYAVLVLIGLAVIAFFGHRFLRGRTATRERIPTANSALESDGVD
jgi:membrane-associated protein